MQHGTLLKSPGVLLSIFWRFLPWYFFEVPWKIAARCIDYLSALGDIFSFFFLLKTLLSPWKSIMGKYPEKGFHLELILQTFFLNLTSRAIGIVIRVIALVIGIVLVLLTIIFFATILFVWFLFPIVLVLDIAYLIGF